MCLHRFCYECIVDTLRLNSAKCPICRSKIVSKRSLRRDTHLDLLISETFPNGDEYDVYQQQKIAKLQKKLSQQAGTSNQLNSHLSGMGQTVKFIAKQIIVAFSIIVSQNSSNVNGNNNDAGTTKLAESNEVQLILKPHPVMKMSLQANMVKYLLTASKTTGIYTHGGFHFAMYKVKSKFYYIFNF